MKTLRIGRMECTAYRGSVYVFITTESGLMGTGEACFLEYPESVLAILSVLNDEVLGRDAWQTEELFFSLATSFAYRDTGLMCALSAIDQACWDLKCKSVDVPLWALLGGKVRDRMRAIMYIADPTADQILHRAKLAVAAGYSALKVIPLVGRRVRSDTERINLAVDIVAQVRQLVGWDIDVAVELHREFTIDEAQSFIARIREFRPLFVEDPILPYSVRLSAELAQDSGIALALGERNFTAWEFADHVRNGSRVVFRADAGVAGGPTQYRKIASLCEANHRKIVPHNYGGPVVNACHLHLGGALPNVDLIEFDPVTSCYWNEITSDSFRPRDGFFDLPGSPGLGITLDREALSKGPTRFPARRASIAQDLGLRYR